VFDNDKSVLLVFDCIKENVGTFKDFIDECLTPAKVGDLPTVVHLKHQQTLSSIVQFNRNPTLQVLERNN